MCLWWFLMIILNILLKWLLEHCNASYLAIFIQEWNLQYLDTLYVSRLTSIVLISVAQKVVKTEKGVSLFIYYSCVEWSKFLFVVLVFSALYLTEQLKFTNCYFFALNTQVTCTLFEAFLKGSFLWGVGWIMFIGFICWSGGYFRRELILHGGSFRYN